jgi:hypothetical protein
MPPSPPFSRATERFRVYGLDLNNPPDSVRPGYYPILENVRSYTDGVVEPRQGLTLVSTSTTANVLPSKTPVHSIRRLNDPNTNNFQRIVGVGDALAYGTNTFAQATYASTTSTNTNVVTSGNPLVLIPYRPDQSPASWMYMADSAVMRKIVGNNSQSIATGTVHGVGVTPPVTAPSIYTGPHAVGNEKIAFSSVAAGTTDTWVRDNVVLTTALSVASRITTIAPTATVVDGTPGATLDWISLVVPTTTIATIGVGTYFECTDTTGLVFAQVVAAQIFEGNSSTTTIGSIRYENSPTNTGVCVVSPAVPIKQIRQNSIVKLNASYYRVLELISGPDETFAFTVNTGATSHTAGQTLEAMPSIRFYDWSGFMDTGVTSIQDLNSGAGSIAGGGAGTSTTKTGWIMQSFYSVKDLSRISDSIL